MRVASRILLVGIFFSFTVTFAQTSENSNKAHGATHSRGLPNSVAIQSGDDLSCNLETQAGTKFKRKLWNGYFVTVQAKGELADSPCELFIGRPGQKPVFDARAFSVDVDEHTGDDIFNDKTATVVLTSDQSGGAHCCTTYSFLTLDNHPRLVAELTPGGSLDFKKNAQDGRTEIWTYVSNFDYFEGLCHACSPYPRVVYRFENRKMRIVTPNYCKTMEYGLGPDELAQDDFLQFRRTGSDKSEMTHVVSDIILAAAQQFLCGEDQDAIDTIHDAWPAADQDRIVKEIRKRISGLLPEKN